jgi:hypothetical protein
MQGDNESNRHRSQCGDAITASIAAAALIAVLIIGITAPSHIEAALTGLAAVATSLRWRGRDEGR